MFWYILPEFIILVAVWTQQFYEILLGVHENREIDLENISEARDRFLRQFNEQTMKIMQEHGPQEESSEPAYHVQEAPEQPLVLSKEEA